MKQDICSRTFPLDIRIISFVKNCSSIDVHVTLFNRHYSIEILRTFLSTERNIPQSGRKGMYCIRESIVSRALYQVNRGRQNQSRLSLQTHPSFLRLNGNKKLMIGNIMYQCINGHSPYRMTFSSRCPRTVTIYLISFYTARIHVHPQIKSSLNLFILLPH